MLIMNFQNHFYVVHMFKLFLLLKLSTAETEEFFDKVVNYLKSYNDVTVGDILVLGDEIGCNSRDEWCTSIWDVERRTTRGSLPFVFMSNNLNYSSEIIALKKVLSLSQKTSLVLMKSFDTSANHLELLKSLPEAFLRDNVWLILHPITNFTEQSIKNLIMNTKLNNLANLKFNSQVKNVKFNSQYLNSYLKISIVS